ncbi:ankyrin repeat-containing protein [Anaeramoeba ignava]|uniref:Ankyrin repeat-containing protein n=1 Tax=Anaeramoeba ignava TaxID=1746090 RepID=A0A9Q0LDH0_ANAIG|nr:ankyrin repeat-containing protein [Anaeramoeba ignava]
MENQENNQNIIIDSTIEIQQPQINEAKTLEEKLKILEELFEKSDTKNNEGGTLLHHFATIKPIDMDLFNHFIKEGVDWNQQNWSPVHYLCRNQSITFDVIKLLVDNGANFKLDGWTPLHDLCENTSITKDMVQLLFDKGADFHIQYVNFLNQQKKNIKIHKTK